MIMEEEKYNLKDELKRIVDALYILTPAENKIIQFAFLAEGKDLEIMKKSFPELLEDKNTRKNFLDVIGLEVKPDGKIDSGGCYKGGCIKRIAKEIYEKLCDDESEFRNKLSVLIGEELEDPSRAWVNLRLEGLSALSKEEKAAKNAIIILKSLQEAFRKANTTRVSIDTLKEALKDEIDENELSEALGLLEQYNLITIFEYKDKRELVFSSELEKHADLLAEY